MELDQLTVGLNANGVYPMAPSFDTIGWFSNNIKTFQKIGEVLLDKNENENITFNQFVIAEDLLELVDTDIKNQFNSYYKELHPNIKHINISRFNTHLSKQRCLLISSNTRNRYRKT